MNAGFSGLVDSSLDSFLDFLFDGLSGYVFVGTLESNGTKEWVERTAYNWPADKSDIKSFIVAFRKTQDVYISPAVFSAPVHKKEAFKASNVAWAEYDAGWNEEGQTDFPSLRIASSEGREHHYYRMIQPFEDYESLERTNRAIAYRTGADKSGWDSVQLLRPVHSVNHKYAQPHIVKTIEYKPLEYPTGILDSGYTAPEEEHEITLDQVMPTASEILLKYSFNEDFIRLYTKKEPDKSSSGQSRRSEALYALALMCVEHGLSDTEIYVILTAKDKQWGKFKDRADKRRRYLDLVKIAREKTSLKKEQGAEAPQENELPPLLGWKSMMCYETKGDWLIEDVWLDYTMNAMLGVPGLGKTQLSMRFGMAMALGKTDYLEFNIPNQKKVLFMSLELNAFGIQRFMNSMDKTFTEAEREILEENFRIWAPGMPLDLGTPYGQDYARSLIRDSGAEVVFIDSMGASSPGGLNDTQRMADVLRFSSQLNASGTSTWFVAHPRKAENTSHKPRRPVLADLFGDQAQGAIARGVYGIHGDPGDSTFEFLRIKQTFAAPTKEIRIVERNSELDFRVVKYGKLGDKVSETKGKSANELLNHYEDDKEGLGSI